MRIFILILLSISFSINANAQACSGPGRTPDGAQAVCGYLPFNEKIVSNCQGPDIPNPTSGCGQVTSDNSIWYKFHCYVSGTFGFLLTPASGGDDYDWEIMDITGHQPADVYTMELRVSLNLSGQTGPTGCTAAGISDINCGGGAAGTQYNRLLNIVAGHDYVMMVNNWTSSTQGYNLVFNGTASLVNPVTPYPSITNVSLVGCDASKVKITFSEDILCDSISPITGTEFSITGGTHPLTGIVSACDVSAKAVPWVILNLQTPLPAGNYQLNVGVGSDGNTLSNVCRNTMAPASFPFTVPAIVPAAVNNITYSGCAPTLLNVKLDKPVWCSTITFSGSNGEFAIQPGNIPILSAQGVCSGTPSYADMIQVTLQNPLPYGNYQLVISNGADGNTFTDTCGNNVVAASIPFAINQTTVAPLVQSIGFDECHPDKIVVNFDKPVKCASISPTGNEFTVTPGPLAISNVTYSCGGVGNYITQAVLTMQNPLPAGNFAVNIGAGTDGNSLSDTCYVYMANGYSKAFTATKAPAPKFDSVQFDKCNPSFAKLFYSNAIKCSSISADGSDYNITGPSAVTINAIVTDGNCGTLGYTKWVLLQFAQPVNVFGNYVIHNKVGTDLNGIIDTCNASQSTAETIGFTALVKPTAAYTTQVKFGCVMDTIIFSHPGGNGITTWTWSFPDGTTASGQTVTHVFPVSTPSVTVQLTVDNGSCNDVVSQTITLGNSFKAAFASTPKDTTCISAQVNFANGSNGNNLQYLWDFGDNTTFAGQTPPPHAYSTTGTYTVQLTATDVNGCKDVATGKMEVLPAATIDFTGLNPQYCSDNTVSLTKVSSSTILTYTWDDGDGMTIQNKPTVQLTYPNEGVYTIKLTGTDKYCGTAVASKQVQIYAVPVVNLGNDTILCPAMAIQLGPLPVAGYTYLWSNGATTSQVTTDMFTSSYTLSVDNHGCKASDAIGVKILTACLIMVPNAFTPNNDGNNDKLKPTNADLAKEFSFKVFNRYGVLVFATTNPTEGWDGTYRGARVETGTYVWQLRYIDPWNGKKVAQNGSSILLR
ncbi:gliding motility-associated C-terminal domain-containing protein [Ferruginibacter sp.]